MTARVADRAPARSPRDAEPGAPLSEWAAVASCPRRLLIGGEFREARGERTLTVSDPSTGRPLCEIADADERDALEALAAAAASMPAWAASAPNERARVLRRSADSLMRDVDRVAMLITLEMGKPLAESREEVAFAAEYLEWCAEEALRASGTVRRSPDGSSCIVVERRPVGPCLIVTPWNFPLAVPARGVAAALAAGCTVVLRPSSLTPLTAMALAAILVDEGLPAGVLNLVVSSADGVTDPLLRDGRLRRLTFTGSTEVGRHLISASAGQILRVGVELGGQAPFLVLDDADLEAAVDGAVAAKMRNGGQACTAANRFYVHQKFADEFTRRLADQLGALTIGRGVSCGVDLGPMIGDPQRCRLVELVEDAKRRGGDVVLDGGALPGTGHFFAPVVVQNIPGDARLAREEIFGPIAVVSPFSCEAAVVEEINACPQGLGAYLYSGDVDRACRLGAAMEVGMVAINRGRISSVAAPFGGAKQSGFGVAGGEDPLDDYLRTQALTR